MSDRRLTAPKQGTIIQSSVKTGRSMAERGVRLSPLRMGFGLDVATSPDSRSIIATT